MTNTSDLPQHKIVLNAFKHMEGSIFHGIREMKIKTIKNYYIIPFRVAKVNK